MVVVVVLWKASDGQGVLRLHALSARAAVQAGIGQKLNASILLCLKAYGKIFDHLSGCLGMAEGEP